MQLLAEYPERVTSSLVNYTVLSTVRWPLSPKPGQESGLFYSLSEDRLKDVKASTQHNCSDQTDNVWCCLWSLPVCYRGLWPPVSALVLTDAVHPVEPLVLAFFK